jgi:hypothetical protein
MTGLGILSIGSQPRSRKKVNRTFIFLTRIFILNPEDVPGGRGGLGNATSLASSRTEGIEGLPQIAIGKKSSDTAASRASTLLGSKAVVPNIARNRGATAGLGIDLSKDVFR